MKLPAGHPGESPELREVRQRLTSLIERTGPSSGNPDGPAQFSKELWGLPRADLARMVMILVAEVDRVPEPVHAAQ